MSKENVLRELEKEGKLLSSYWAKILKRVNKDFANVWIDQVKKNFKLTNGKKKGESFEDEMREVMKEKNQEPIGCTELSKEELLKDAMIKNNSILQINVNDEGKTEFKYYRKLDKDEA